MITAFMESRRVGQFLFGFGAVFAALEYEQSQWLSMFLACVATGCLVRLMCDKTLR